MRGLSMYGIIYKITNKENNKIYIGQTTQSLSKRFRQHYNVACRKEKEGKHLTNFQYALLKYGINSFIVEQIDTADDREDLDQKEISWIKFYNSINKNVGYNIVKGGLGGGTTKNYTWYTDGLKDYYLKCDEVPKN